MDSFILLPCYAQAAEDCLDVPPATICPNQDTTLPMEQQGFVTDEFFSVGGTVGKTYLMTLRVNGILEAKYYENGVRSAGNADPANPDNPAGNDTWYTGGDPVNVENYNVYKITVRMPPAAGAMPGTAAEVQHYYLNSFPQTATPYEYHETFPVSFTHDIPVPGGGVIEYLTEDRNCRSVDNCGAGFHAVACAGNSGRTVPNESSLVIPATYMGQPVSSLNAITGASQPFHAQIAHLTVTAVTEM